MPNLRQTAIEQASPFQFSRPEDRDCLKAEVNEKTFRRPICDRTPGTRRRPRKRPTGFEQKIKRALEIATPNILDFGPCHRLV